MDAKTAKSKALDKQKQVDRLMEDMLLFIEDAASDGDMDCTYTLPMRASLAEAAKEHLESLGYHVSYEMKKEDDLDVAKIAVSWRFA